MRPRLLVLTQLPNKLNGKKKKDINQHNIELQLVVVFSFRVLTLLLFVILCREGSVPICM